MIFTSLKPDYSISFWTSPLCFYILISLSLPLWSFPSTPLPQICPHAVFIFIRLGLQHHKVFLPHLVVFPSLSTPSPRRFPLILPVLPLCGQCFFASAWMNRLRASLSRCTELLMAVEYHSLRRAARRNGFSFLCSFYQHMNLWSRYVSFALSRGDGLAYWRTNYDCGSRSAKCAVFLELTFKITFFILCFYLRYCRKSIFVKARLQLNAVLGNLNVNSGFLSHILISSKFTPKIKVHWLDFSRAVNSSTVFDLRTKFNTWVT